MDRPYLPRALRAGVTADAGNLCGYCLSPEVLMGASLVFDHIIPVAAGGTSTRENLWRACRQCNEYKGARTHSEDQTTSDVTPLFNPRTQIWSEHFRWNPEFTQIIGITPTGRVTVSALQLNRDLIDQSTTKLA